MPTVRMELRGCSHRVGFVLLFLLTATGGFTGGQQCPAVFAPSEVFGHITYNYSSSPFVELFTNLDKIIPVFVAENSISSHAVSIVHRDRTIYTSGLIDTKFRIGSLTKIFTSLGALILKERGLLSLDDPVKKFLTSFSIINPYGEHHDITLRELMGHVSGLPRDLCNYFNECANEETKVLKLISRMQLSTPPWSNLPAYSNLGYALLGHAWEKATSPRQPWEEFVMDEIVKPLGMDSTGVDVFNITLAPAIFPPQHIGWIAPAGEMYSTATDLSKLMAFLLTGKPHLISTITMREWMHPVTLFPDDKAGFALPWELTKLKRGASFIVSKSGIIGGFNSYLAFDPTTQIGVSLLTSQAQAEASQSAPVTMGNSILSTFIPALETVNNDLISTAYTGVYDCVASPPVEGPTLNKSIQVLGGNISVTATPSLGLVAMVRVTLVEEGQIIAVDLDSTLLLKNATERSFWINTGPGCQSYALNLGIFPDFYSPNTQGSTFSFVLFFDLQAKTIKWPSVGAICSLQFD